MASTPKVLFVYYSFTNQTRSVAGVMAAELRARGCDVTEATLEFTDEHYGKRFSKLPMSWPVAKITGMLPSQLRRKTGTIRIPPEAGSGGYDLVVIGSPTWWLTTCMPVRSYLHDRASMRTLAGTPFAVFTTSRRYYKGNIKTIRSLAEDQGGVYIDDTHFVADGNQVMSMWSWLAFMRHNKEKRRSFGVPLPKPNLRVDFATKARVFIDRVAGRVLTPAVDHEVAKGP